MAGTIHTSARDYLNGLADILRQVKGEAIERFTTLLFDAWKEDRQALFFGNGGSASTASHHVLDLVKTASVPGQRPLRALAMNDNIGIVTAVGNDLEYAQTFSVPLAVYGRRGDLAVAISASGNSPNILAACKLARERGLRVVALTGFAGGKVAEMADLHINVPSDNYGIIEDLHLSIGHIVAQSLKARVQAFAAGAESRKAV
jgi:D-sedoheptulose 7-phosphate isomerase